nr:MAG TPA: hypothetical protein [Caudoviricetes sp.]
MKKQNYKKSTNIPSRRESKFRQNSHFTFCQSH